MTLAVLNSRDKSLTVMELPEGISEENENIETWLYDNGYATEDLIYMVVKTVNIINKNSYVTI
jgi:hypothetical protein